VDTGVMEASAVTEDKVIRDLLVRVDLMGGLDKTEEQVVVVGLGVSE
jgi:hypothetical protein